MTRKYYAGTLKDSNPGAIENVFSFEDYSQRKQWLTENHFPEGQRVKIGNRIAKKHKQVQVTFENTAKLAGAKIWAWVYDGKADWLTQRFE
jgi:hypothetical protein